MGLGSTSQIMNFVDQRIGELKNAIRGWEDEYEMWAKLDSRPGDTVPAAARGHLRARQRELADAMSAAKHETGILQELRTSFDPCPHCQGAGGFSVQYDQDDIRIEPCEACKGTKVRTK